MLAESQAEIPRLMLFSWYSEMAGQACLVANTDERWFNYLTEAAANGRLDEVNFWRPLGNAFRALSPGEPLFFRLKAPISAIVGYGFFAHFTFLPIDQAWRTFAERNGDPSFDSFLNRIAAYRKESPAETLSSGRSLGCIVLREVRLLDREQWLPWSEHEGWHPRIQQYKAFDLLEGAGRLLRDMLQATKPAELEADFRLVEDDLRTRNPTLIMAREGQGAFRVRILDAYGRRCSVTGERLLPVLEAAHIQPYLGPASNHVQNGISLRADIHRLFDTGYVTVTPEGYRFEVSKKLRQDYENGRDYYELDGRPLIVPNRPDLRPSREALEWHASHVFRG